METIQKMYLKLSINARVSLTLATAQRALGALVDEPDLYTLADIAVKNCWAWEIAHEKTAQELYVFIHKLLAFESELKKVKRSVSALFAIVAAVYYTTWHADKLQRLSSRKEYYSSLPNDMAEIGEEYVSLCLEYAAQAASNQSEELKWQHAILNRLIADFSINTTDNLGVSISPEYFENK